MLRRWRGGRLLHHLAMNGDAAPAFGAQTPEVAWRSSPHASSGAWRVDQIRGLGVGKTSIERWRASGFLHPVLPRVYAVGHPGRGATGALRSFRPTNQRDLELHAAGNVVLRYTGRQLIENPAAVAADIRRYL